MLLPPWFRIDDRAEVQAMIAGRGYGHLVAAAIAGTVADDGRTAFEATPMPFVLRGDDIWSVAGHLARANPLTRCGGSALMIVAGADTYVSPSWYPSKAADGRVVPTWNYEVVHLHGELIIHDDPTWLGELIRQLTDLHEAVMPMPWSVDDAPDEFIERQLRGIIGVELVVERVDAKRKLSQNRTDEDRAGVVAGLESSPHRGARRVLDAISRLDA